MDDQPRTTEPYPDTNTRSIYLGSTRLAHEHLVAQSQVVLRLGRILMKSGASAYRIKASMARLAKAVGLKEHHAQVTFTEISTSSYTEGNFRTEVAEQRTMGINAHKLDQLGKFISELPEKITPAEANAELDRIDSAKPLYTRWMLALASAVACVWGGVIAAVANPIRIHMVEAGMPAHMAATIAVFGVGILAEIVAPLHQRKYTRISLSVPAVVTMVPGVPFYRSMSHFASGDMYSAWRLCVCSLIRTGCSIRTLRC